MRCNRFISRFMVFGILALVALSMTLLYTASAYAKGSHRTDTQDNAGNTTRSTEQTSPSSSASSNDTSSSRHSSQQETRRVDPAQDTSNNRSEQTTREVRRNEPPPPTVDRNTYQAPDSGKGHQREPDPPVIIRQNTPPPNNSDQQIAHGNRDSNKGSSSSSEQRFTPGGNSPGNRNSGNSSSSSSESRYTPGGNSSGNTNSGSGSSSSSEQRFTPGGKNSNNRNSNNGSSSSSDTRSNIGSSDSRTKDTTPILKSTTNHRPLDQQTPSGANTRSEVRSNPNVGRTTIPQSAIRSDIPRSTHIPNVTGVFRKDYKDLGDIWKSRREHQDTRYDNNGRFDRNDNRSHTNISVNFNFFPNARYRYYAYDYDPWYSYPSVYCYYGGLFPPYIYGHRVTYIHHNIVTYRYIEIPVNIIYRDTSSYRSDADEYYLSNYRYQDLSDALRNIEKSWEKGDADMLNEHVRPDEKVDIYLKDEYSYSLESQDFEEMTRDAMSHIDTYKFDIYRVRQRDSSTVVAYAEHQYRDDASYVRDSDDYAFGDRLDAKMNKVYVRYTLDRIGSEWFITEVGTSPTKEN